MSTVTKADCVLCNPQAGDLNGIRRPIAGGVTSEEIFVLVNHIIKTHTPEIAAAQLAAEAADDVARSAVKIANGVTQRLNAEYHASKVPATLPANSGNTLRVVDPVSQGTVDGYKASVATTDPVVVND